MELDHKAFNNIIASCNAGSLRSFLHLKRNKKKDLGQAVA
jgi:hypothetical protein